MDLSNCHYTQFPFDSQLICHSIPEARPSPRSRTTSESTTARVRDVHPTRGVGSHSPPGWPADTPTSAGKPNSHVDLDDGSSMRSRTGSKGIRDFFRLMTRTVNEDVDRKSTTAADRKSRNGLDPYSNLEEGHGVAHSPRLAQLKESIRPRSQSDASSMKRPPRRGAGSESENKSPLCRESSAGRESHADGEGQTNTNHRNHYDHSAEVHRRSRAESRDLESTINTLRVSGFPIGNGEMKNPVNSPLSPLGRMKSPSHIGPAEFIEMYRSRAYSDPRPQARLEAVSNVRMRRLTASRQANNPGYPALASLEEKKLILWRDKKEGNQLLVLPTDCSEDSKIESINLNERVQLAYCDVLKITKCYDIIPNSTKMVILDSRLSVKKALYALLNNGIRAAPIWDSTMYRLSGMLTITDFIRVLRRYYHSQPHEIESLEDHSISTFKAICGESSSDRLTDIRPDESLLDAISALSQNAIHRLPVVDPATGNILYMLTYKRLLNFLSQTISTNAPTFIQKTIEELKIGTYENIAMVSHDTPVISALETLIERGISSLPVVDSDRKLVSMYSRSDVIHLAAEKTYSKLDMTIGDLLNGQNPMVCADCICTCQKTETLLSVVSKLSRREVRRLPVVDVSGHVIGVVSASDVLRYFAAQENTTAVSGLGD